MKRAADGANKNYPRFLMDPEQTADFWRSHNQDQKNSWEGRRIDVRWDDTTSVSYRLALLKQYHAGTAATFRQPIASAYEAQPLQPDAGKTLSSFVIKVPVLDGLKQQQDLEERLGRVSFAYQQEYNLRDRFPPGQPKVLPALMPAVWNGLLESEHPYVELAQDSSGHNIRRIPCVVREYIKGTSLQKWIRLQASSEAPAFYGLSDINTWFELASALFRALAELHRERATHGFIFPGNILLRPQAAEALASGGRIADDCIVFINAAEGQRSVYLEESKVTDDAKQFAVRRWYDSADNLYRFVECKAGWARFDLHLGSDYYSATDIFSLGVTLALLATGDASAACPFDYVQPWLNNKGWQIVRGAEARRRYQVMKAKLLDSLLIAGEWRQGQKKPDERGSKKQIYENSLRQCEVILHCIRSRADRRAISPNHALSVLRLFRSPETYSRTQTVVPSSVGARVNSRAVSNDKRLARSLIALAHEIKQDPGKSEALVANLLSHCHLHHSGRRLGKDKISPVMVKLVGDRMRSVLERITSLDYLPSNGTALSRPATANQHTPYLRVVGSRTTLVDAFLTALSSLTAEDEIIALTTATMWGDQNFGPTSRVSSMLQLLRLSGMPLQWVIIVDRNDECKPDTQRVLGFRCADDHKIAELRAAAQQEQKAGPNGAERGRDETRYDGFYYACLDSSAYEKLLREKKTFIGFRRARILNGAADEARPLQMHIAPDLSSRGGTLGALTFWMHPRRGQRLLTAFETHRGMATPVFNFERKL